MADGSETPGDELSLQPASVVRAPRRRALWGVLAGVAVAAGALAVTSGGGSGSPPVLPVALGATGRDEAAGAASPSAADMRAAWITYVAGDGLPELGGQAPAYRLTGGVDEARVRALADSLGVTGDPTHEDGYWHLQTGDAVLEVYEDGGGSWWYSVAAVGDAVGGSSSSGGGSAGCGGGPAVDCATAEGAVADAPTTTVLLDECAEKGATCTSAVPPAIAECPDGAACVDVPSTVDCTQADAPCVDPGAAPCAPDDGGCIVPPPIEPPVPVDLPSEAEARQIALDLLASTGMDVDGAAVTVDGPYDAWYVTVEPVLDGVPVSGGVASVSVGSDGLVSNASGTLAQPDRLGEYELIDTRAAVDRLNELQSSWGYPMPLGARDSVSSSGTATAQAPTATTPCAPDDPSCSVLVDPVPPAMTVEDCAVQPDGTEICTSAGGSSDTGCPTSPDAPAPSCPPVLVCGEPIPATATDGAPETTLASHDCVEPVPYPEPEPIEVTLTDAERVLVLMPSVDGNGDAYLLPAYRFSADDGTIAEVAAVADESLAPTTTVPESTESTELPAPPPTTCDTLVEDDGSGTTHTVNPCPDEMQPRPPDLTHLSEGEQPQVGVPYYVDVAVMTGHCSWVSVEVAGAWWWAGLSNEQLASWSTPTEGGTFTLVDEDHATFVGDAQATKVADLVRRDTEPGCA